MGNKLSHKPISQSHPLRYGPPLNDIIYATPTLEVDELQISRANRNQKAQRDPSLKEMFTYFTDAKNAEAATLGLKGEAVVVS